jgi:hypothetical protein
LKNESLKHLILLLIVVIPLFFQGLSNHGLWSADEPRIPEIGREMAVNGNWAVPMLNQRPFLEEPPLYYGALALTFKAFGEASDKVARIPSAFFAFGTVLVLFFVVIETEEIGKDLLSKEEPFYLMIRDRIKVVEKELLSTGKLHLLVKQLMGSERTLVLFSNRPALNTTTIGGVFKKVEKERVPA